MHVISPSIGDISKTACYQFDSNTMATQWLLPPHLPMKKPVVNNAPLVVLFFSDIIWVLRLVETTQGC